jgi:Cu+-exporting ATPase
MDCVSCAVSIEIALKSLKGVKDARVSYATGKLFLEQDGSVKEEEIKKVIEDTGYFLDEGDGDSHNTNHSGHHDIVMPHQDSSNGKDQGGPFGGAQGGHGHAKAESEGQTSLLKKKLTFGIVASIIVLFLSFGGQTTAFIPKQLSLLAMLALSIPVEFWVGKQFWRGTYFEFKRLRPGMDSLVVLGTGTAFFFSATIAIMRLMPQFSGFLVAKFDPYFDVAVVVTTFIILGKYLEAKAKSSASEAIKKLLQLQAKTAHLVDSRGNIRDLDVSLVKIGDILLVKQGEKVPTDGIIVEGSASLDESMVSGESMPVDKKSGDKVIGATINKSGLFQMKAQKIGSETFLAQIIRVVEEAQASKAPIQRLADKITEIFVPIVIVVAIGTFIAWMLIGPSPKLSYSLVNMVAVLVVACPCALGLATPIAVITGTGKGASQGIIIRNAQALEVAGKIKTVVLDKTGTITKGEPAVTDIQLTTDGERLTAKEILQIAASLGQNTTHPLDKSVVAKAKEGSIELKKVADFTAMTGMGISGKIDGAQYYFGNRKLMADKKIEAGGIESKMETLERDGKTTLMLADERAVVGIVGIADTLKSSAQETVARLKKIGIEVWMITGDNEKTAQAIAKKVGIDNVMASVLPEQKSQKIKELQQKGEVVAMVGDGINDAPALTQADVGIAIGTGTDIAIESAGITLVSGDPLGIYKAILLSRKTLANIKQNLFWAYAYNVILIPVAAGIFYPFFGILLNPILAGAAMAFSSLSVVLNSLRLKRIKLQ